MIEGSNLITLSAYDAAGNSKNISRIIKLDTTSPIVEIDSLSNLTNQQNIELTGLVSGTIMPTVILSLNGTNQTISLIDGLFSETITLVEGLNSIIVIAEDAAGNVGNDFVNITLDTTPPNILLTVGTGATKTINVTSDGSIVKLTVRNPVGVSRILSLTKSGSIYSGTFTPEKNGAYLVFASAWDDLNNAVNTSSSFNSEILKLSLRQINKTTFKVISNLNLDYVSILINASNGTPVAYANMSGSEKIYTYSYIPTSTDTYAVKIFSTHATSGTRDSQSTVFDYVVQSFTENASVGINSTSDSITLQIVTNETIGNVSIMINEYNESETSTNITGNQLLSQYVDFNVDEELENAMSNVTIEICYDPAELVTKGISEQDLKLFLFNEDTSLWEPLDSVVNVTENCVSRVQDHFSTYSIGGNYSYDVNVSVNKVLTHDSVTINLTADETKQKNFEILIKKDNSLKANITSSAAHSDINEWTYIYNVPTNDDGLYVVEVTSTDNFNTQDTDSTNFNVDTTNPIITITAPNLTSSSTQAITISISENVVSKWYLLNGTTTNLSENSFSINLDEGINNLVVKAQDSAGNIGSKSIVITLDTNPPSIDSPNQTNVVEKGSSQTIVVKITDNEGVDSVKFEMNGTNTSLTSSNDIYSYSPSTSTTGVKNYKIYAEDEPGNKVSYSGSYSVVDTSNPIVTITSPNSGTTRSTSVTLIASVTEYAETSYELDSGLPTSFFNGTSGTKSFTSLSSGSHTIYVNATDLEGNKGFSSITFNVDLAPDCTLSEEVTSACFCDGTKYAEGYCCSSGYSTDICTTSGGGSGGGSNLVVDTTTLNAVTNIQDKFWTKAEAGQTKTIILFDIGVSKLSFVFKEEKSNVGIEVEKISDPIITKPGNVYEYIEITKNNFVNSDLESANMEFVIEKTWLQLHNIDPNNVALFRLTSQWDELETLILRSDSENYYYTSKIPGFSLFSIAESEQNQPIELSSIPAPEIVSESELELPAKSEDLSNNNTKSILPTGQVVSDFDLKDGHKGIFNLTWIIIIAFLVVVLSIYSYLQTASPMRTQDYLRKSQSHKIKATKMRLKANNSNDFSYRKKADKHDLKSNFYRDKANVLHRKTNLEKAIYLHKKGEACHKSGDKEKSQKYYELAQKYRERSKKSF